MRNEQSSRSSSQAVSQDESVSSQSSSLVLSNHQSVLRLIVEARAQADDLYKRSGIVAGREISAKLSEATNIMENIDVIIDHYLGLDEQPPSSA